MTKTTNLFRPKEVYGGWCVDGQCVKGWKETCEGQGCGWCVRDGRDGVVCEGQGCGWCVRDGRDSVVCEGQGCGWCVRDGRDGVVCEVLGCGWCVRDDVWVSLLVA